MGLAEQQKVLARLYTDAGFRERFLADREGMAASLGLSPEDVQQVANLSSTQVRFVAQSLYRKRLGEVRKLLPATHQALGLRFGTLFREFADTHTPASSKKHLGDALAFAVFVEGSARGDPSMWDWIVDLVRYEAAWLEATTPHCRCLIRWFRYPVLTILRRLAEGADPSPMARRPTLAFWFRPPGRARLRHALWAVPPGGRARVFLRVPWRRGRREAVRAS